MGQEVKETPAGQPPDAPPSPDDVDLVRALDRGEHRRIERKLLEGEVASDSERSPLGRDTVQDVAPPAGVAGRTVGGRTARELPAAGLEAPLVAIREMPTTPREAREVPPLPALPSAPSRLRWMMLLGLFLVIPIGLWLLITAFGPAREGVPSAMPSSSRADASVRQPSASAAANSTAPIAPASASSSSAPPAPLSASAKTAPPRPTAVPSSTPAAPGGPFGKWPM